MQFHSREDITNLAAAALTMLSRWRLPAELSTWWVSELSQCAVISSDQVLWLPRLCHELVTYNRATHGVVLAAFLEGQVTCIPVEQMVIVMHWRQQLLRGRICVWIRLVLPFKLLWVYYTLSPGSQLHHPCPVLRQLAQLTDKEEKRTYQATQSLNQWSL